MSDDRSAPDPQARELPDLGGSVEDTRTLFDELFGDEGASMPVGGAAVSVAEVVRTDPGPATVATRAVDAPVAGAPPAAGPRPRPRNEDSDFWGEPDEARAAARRRDRGRVRARKVRRIIRHIEPWSVLKVSLFFFLTLWLILLVAGVLMWAVAVNRDVIASIEDFVENLMGYEEFRFLPDQIFRAYALGGLVVCVGLSAFSVIVTLIFNLISDLMGGIRVTVIEEERVRRS